MSALQSDKEIDSIFSDLLTAPHRLHAVGMFDTYSGTKSLILNYIYVQYGYYEGTVIEDLDSCRETHIRGVRLGRNNIFLMKFQIPTFFL